MKKLQRQREKENKKGKKFMFKAIVIYIGILLGIIAIAHSSTGSKLNVMLRLDSMQKDNTIISVTTGKNRGYYELYNNNGETVARTFSGDTTEIYKDGNVWSFKEQEDDREVKISSENGLTTLAFLHDVVKDYDTQVDTELDKDNELIYTFATHKLPTQNKLLSEFIKDNIKGFTGLRIEYKEKPTLQINIEIESEGNKRTSYCTFIGYQVLYAWRLDRMWNEQLESKDTENLLALRARELAKLQQNIQGYMRENNKKKLKNSQNITGEEYAKATDEGKQEYIDKALNEVVNGLNVPFIGDRVSLKKEVDGYYQKNGNVPNLIEVVQYICYTNGLFAPYEYALANNDEYTTQYQQG